MAPLIFIDFDFQGPVFDFSLNGWTLCLVNVLWKQDFINSFCDIFWQIVQLINFTTVIWWKNTILNSQRAHSHNEMFCKNYLWKMDNNQSLFEILSFYSSLSLSSYLALQCWYTFPKSSVYYLVKFLHVNTRVSRLLILIIYTFKRT